jgi:FkbM family methyltransferase
MSIARFFATHPLTASNPAAAWWRFVFWQVRSRLQTETTLPWISGTKLAVRRGMTGATGNIYCGLHEFADMAFALHVLRPDDLFLDVGANVGSYTVLASGVCGARSIAFEPDPDAADALERNIAINSLGDLVTLHRNAVGIDGDVRFTIGLDTVNHIDRTGERNTRVVPSVSFNSLDCRPTLIKLDVEGGEDDVICNGRSMLAKTEAIIIETVSGKTRAALNEAGFTRAFYSPFKRLLSTAPPLSSSPTGNSLYIKNFDFVTSRVQSARAVSVLGYSI